MNWTIFGRIADILTVVSFVISLGILRKITKKTEDQKRTYSEERDAFLAHIRALRDNIWEDGLKSPKIQDELQSAMYEYQQKYALISSPVCLFHTFRCIHLLKQGFKESSMHKIRQDVNYVIARLSKKE